MFHGIERNGGLFTTAVADELNTAISGIDEKIDKFSVSDLEYKYPVRKLTLSVDDETRNYLTFRDNSFSVGKAYYINFSFTPRVDLDVEWGSKLNIASLTFNPGVHHYFDIVWIGGMYNFKGELESEYIYITNPAPEVYKGGIGVITLKKDRTYYVSFSIIKS